MELFRLEFWSIFNWRQYANIIPEQATWTSVEPFRRYSSWIMGLFRLEFWSIFNWQLKAICKHYSRSSNLNFCGTIQTLFIMGLELWSFFNWQLKEMCKHYSRASNLNFCGTIQTLFIMDYGALPSGILEYFQLTIKGNMQTLFQSKQLELLWNYSDVIHHGLTMRNIMILRKTAEQPCFGFAEKYGEWR